MNRLILLLLLLGIGMYVYIVLYKNNSYFSNQYEKDIEPINDEYIEQPIRRDRHVHFSERNTEHIIPNKEQIKQEQYIHEQYTHAPIHAPIHEQIPEQENLYNDIFIVDPIEIKNTDLTLSENEYFNNY